MTKRAHQPIGQVCRVASAVIPLQHGTVKLTRGDKRGGTKNNTNRLTYLMAARIEGPRAIQSRHQRRSISSKSSNSATSTLPFGSRLYAALESHTVIETTGWAAERVARVAARLQRHRAPTEQFEVVVPWLDEHTAFTAPGRYIFFSRRLLELCPHDGAAAFIIAHEIAHHELGHLGEAARWLTCALGHGGARLVTTLYRLIERTLFSAQNEADADAHALDLCMRAGYDPQKCLVVFAILQKIALDFRATDEALGTDELQDEHMRRSQWTRRWHAVWYQLRRGYPSIQERRARLDQHLEKKLVALSGRIAGLTPTQLAWVRWGGRARNWFESCISETVLARVPYE